VVTKFANQQAVSMGLGHAQRVVFVDGCFFLGNFVTFLTRFVIFHYLLFSERTSKPRPAQDDRAVASFASRD
jgi:hypothetical protein